jgi:hypothetical protein
MIRVKGATTGSDSFPQPSDAAQGLGPGRSAHRRVSDFVDCDRGASRVPDVVLGEIGGSPQAASATAQARANSMVPRATFGPVSDALNSEPPRRQWHIVVERVGLATSVGLTSRFPGLASSSRRPMWVASLGLGGRWC